MIVSRRPRADLRPFVKLLWTSGSAAPAVGRSCRERVLPTGAAHIAIRLGGRPLRLFRGPGDVVGHSVGYTVFSGARASSYIKDLSEPAPTVGALLRPGAVRLAMGVPANVLSGVHIPLEDLWGAAAAELQDRLADSVFPSVRLDILEGFLAARLSGACRIDAVVAGALKHLGGLGEVGPIVARTGCSHRHFVKLFSEEVGLTPKRYSRVVRFTNALDTVWKQPSASWADVAAGGGYADQPHFTREFREFAGLSPNDYRRRASRSAFHVPM